jgi:two-component system phosphate regulon sensor histidine kinase PhoR
MKPLRYDTGFALASLILSTALAIDWLGGMFLKTPFIARCGMLGLAILMSGSAILAVFSRGHRAHEAVRRYLSLLCKSESLQTSDDALAFANAHPEWKEIFSELQNSLRTYAAKAQDTEQAYAAIEIRCRRAEAKARRVEAILMGLPEPVIAINEYDELVLSNPSANRLLDIDEHSTEEKVLHRLVRCERLIELLTDTRRRKGAPPRTIELELADESGRKQWYNATARGVRALGARPDTIDSQGAVAVLRDVSSQKASQKRNAEFVSAVSHEMKTPLAGIKAYTELLIDGDAEDEAMRNECLHVIDGQANRLQRLVDNLLNLARIEAGVVSVSKQSRPLNELLDEAISVVAPSADAKNIKLRRDLSPLYLGILADRDMMLQAAINLLSNAIKYTAPGGTVTLRSRLLDSEVSFEVEDTGVGLSQQDVQRVFEKFYRVHGSKEMAAGTGLGLPLAKHIVEDVHGGRLSVESMLGKGSTFRVSLPCAGHLLCETV